MKIFALRWEISIVESGLYEAFLIFLNIYGGLSTYSIFLWLIVKEFYFSTKNRYFERTFIFDAIESIGLSIVNQNLDTID